VNAENHRFILGYGAMVPLIDKSEKCQQVAILVSNIKVLQQTSIERSYDISGKVCL
jgi:hypothetical protein